MFCKSCGKQIADETKFCAYCGKETGVSETTAQNQPTQKKSAACKNREPVHGSANIRTRQWLLQNTDDFLPEITFGSIGIVLAKILMLISLFVPNTGESRFYEVIYGFTRQLDVDLPEAVIVMPIWENLLAQFDRGSIERDSILTFIVFPLLIFWGCRLLSLVFDDIMIVRKFGKRNTGMSVLKKQFGFAGGILGIYLAVALTIACHNGSFEMYGAGYKLLAAGAAMNFLCAGIDYMLAEKEIQRRLR